MDNVLTGKDYMVHGYLDLENHPDFSARAYRLIEIISNMSTDEIETLNLFGGTNGR